MTNQFPFFSVIIPLYNKAHFIKPCIKSVLQQKFTNFEIIVVDDESTDDSFQVVQEINDRRIRIIQQKNKGAGAARNNGVSYANSHWIAFLDADDYWKNNHLSEIHKSIHEFPKHLIFTTRLTRLLPHKKEILATYNFNIDNQTKPLAYFKNSLKSDLLNTSGVVIEKNFFNKIGRFNESIYSGQDTDLFIRIGLKTDVVFNPTCTFVYNQHSENNISTTPRFKERLLFLDQYETEARINVHLKKYLDLNRFSILMRSKMYGDSTWKQAYTKLNKKSLSRKQLVLMNSPQIVLFLLKKIKFYLEKIGIETSAF